jgi:hypothetical protein
MTQNADSVSPNAEMVGRCDSVCLMLDDRWGSLSNRCELPEGHGGEHHASLNACIPVAGMVWSDPLPSNDGSAIQIDRSGADNG